MASMLAAQERVIQYLSEIPEYVKIKRPLGSGTDGEVWESSRKTAIKALRRYENYCNERDSYLRLQEWGVTKEIDGFGVPEIVGYNDELMIVEMDMMQTPPYIIDFAKVRIDRPPEFSEEVLEYQERQGRERFEHNWPAVKSLLAALESYNIYYVDPQRGNITFPDMP